MPRKTAKKSHQTSAPVTTTHKRTANDHSDSPAPPQEKRPRTMPLIIDDISGIVQAVVNALPTNNDTPPDHGRTRAPTTRSSHQHEDSAPSTRSSRREDSATTTRSSRREDSAPSTRNSRHEDSEPTTSTSLQGTSDSANASQHRPLTREDISAIVTSVIQSLPSNTSNSTPSARDPADSSPSDFGEWYMSFVVYIHTPNYTPN